MKDVRQLPLRGIRIIEFTHMDDIPRAGEHTRDIMMELGYSDSEFREMIEHAIVAAG